MIRRITLGLPFLCLSGLLWVVPSASAQPVVVNVPSTTFIGNTCIWGNSTTPVPAPGILGRSGDRIIRNFQAESAAPGSIILTCNSRFNLTSQLIAAPGVSTAFRNVAGTVCGITIQGGPVNLVNNSCTAPVTAAFNATSSVLQFFISVEGPPPPALPAPAGNYTYTVRATAAPI